MKKKTKKSRKFSEKFATQKSLQIEEEKNDGKI
jgi:hypothetical protein